LTIYGRPRRYSEKPGKLRLEKAILSRHEALGHHSVLKVLSIDIGHPFLIPKDLYFSLQSGKRQSAFALIVVEIPAAMKSDEKEKK